MGTLRPTDIGRGANRNRGGAASHLIDRKSWGG
jgi:hypothetical protein